MLRKAVIVTILLTMVLSAFAFSKKPAKVAKVIDFNFDYIRKTYEYENNFIYSPYSIKNAFASVYMGSKGETAEEIAMVFGFTPQKAFEKSFAAGLNNLNAIRKNGNVKLNISNGLWLQKGFPFNKTYLEICTRAFKTDTRNLDFQTDPEVAGKINSWVNKNTNGMIKQIVAPGYNFSGTKLVVTNAIYFKGDWEHKFMESRTHKREFNSFGNMISTDFMLQKEKFNYAKVEDAAVVELPYKGKELSLMVILPDADLKSVLSKVVTEDIAAWKEQMTVKKVNVIMPKFKMETSLQLTRDLNEMGMPTAFSAKANFSGMSDNSGIFISDVAHKAVIEVNETGSEAAASTMVGMTTSMPPNQEVPVDFIADHPFIYLIRDNVAGEILFIGIMAKPEASKKM